MIAGWGKIRQVSVYAGVSTRTLRDWLRMGLKHSRVRGCVLIRYSSVDDFIERFATNEDAVENAVNLIVGEMKR